MARTRSHRLGPAAAVACRRALERFQSRGVQEVYELGVEPYLPPTLYALGEPSETRYLSDKDDPSTRENRTAYGVSVDPSGVQGVWKQFYHEHDLGLGLRLYAAAADLPMYSGSAAAADDAYSAVDVTWPSVVWWLAFLEKVTWQDDGGRVRQFIPPKRGPWGLWGFPDTRVLVAWPMNRAQRGRRFLFWAGGNLRVGWRGIEG